MTNEELKIIEEDILGKENAGYAYLYPLNGDVREEYAFNMTLENIANFIGANQYTAEKIVLTDMLDRLILDTAGGYIMNCPNQELCRNIIPLLASIQMGECEAGEIPMVSREVFDEYGFLEDQAVTAAELGML